MSASPYDLNALAEERSKNNQSSKPSSAPSADPYTLTKNPVKR